MTRSQIRSDNFRGFRQGVGAALSVILAYFPYGVSYGLLAKQVGFSFLELELTNLLVYAGAAQLVAVGMLQHGASVVSIIAATAILNIRYLLLNASLCTQLQGFKLWQRLALGYYISDETFAVLSAQIDRATQPRSFGLGVNLVGIFAWTSSSAVGFLGSGMIGDVNALGLGFVLPAVFIALIPLMVRNRTAIGVVVLSAAVSVAFTRWIDSTYATMVATITAATFGAAWDLGGQDDD